MTNEQLGAFVDWLKGQRHADLAVWTYPAGDGWRARLELTEELLTVTSGATPREAIAALAAQVMPKPQCCGACSHFAQTTIAPRTGYCKAALPASVPGHLLEMRVRELDGTDCPPQFFQRRPE